VTVFDMSSVFGGHAVMSSGDLTIVNNPLQQAAGLHDSADLAFKDFMAWGEDSDPAWVRYYVTHARTEIYDWLLSMGVTFDRLVPYQGNSVSRALATHGRGLGLVSPVYRECLRNSNVVFRWNAEVVDLLVERGRVVGVRDKDLRSGSLHEFRASAVILATGGFQSNLDLVRKNWPKDMAQPKRLLAGSGINSLGSGLGLASRAGAALTRLDHQWNYERGLPDPRYPGAERGLNASINGVIVNSAGNLFMPKDFSSKTLLQTVLSQPGATYWVIFDERMKRDFWVSGSNWGSFETIDRILLNDEHIVKKASSIDGLAEKTGLPAAALRKSILASVAEGIHIDAAPFYAAQFFPMTRKSMGGIAVDIFAHALDADGKPVIGLYAAGEAAGEAGINGKAALEGTFLGPAVLIGRVAARSAVADFGMGSHSSDRSIAPALQAASKAIGSEYEASATVAATDATKGEACSGCHALATLVNQSRAGYWHFERVHRVVLERKYDCGQCHADIRLPFDAGQHRINRMLQVNTCARCHVAN
jgi:uncharacterized protein